MNEWLWIPCLQQHENVTAVMEDAMDDSLADSLEVDGDRRMMAPQLYTGLDQKQCSCVYKGERCIYVKGHRALHCTGRSGYWERTAWKG